LHKNGEKHIRPFFPEKKWDQKTQERRLNAQKGRAPRGNPEKVGETKPPKRGPKRSLEAPRIKKPP